MSKTPKIAISAGSPYTVEAGKMVLELGGNTIDVAVACAMAATLTEVLMCSLGGSAFFNIHIPGQKGVLIDGADVVPSIENVNAENCQLTKAIVPFGDGIPVNVGPQTIAVPGMLKATEAMWKLGGKLPWKEVVAPAIEMASKGVKADATLSMWLDMAGEAIFGIHPESRKCFFPNSEHPIKKGEHYSLPNYSDTLDYIAREGARGFYEGDLSIEIEKEVKKGNGFLTREDLKKYRAELRNPLTIQSRGAELHLNPPPAVGGAMLGSMIQLYEHYLEDHMTKADRNLLLANVQKQMLSLRESESKGDWNRARADMVLELEWLKRNHGKLFSPNTLHFSVAGSDGVVIAATMSQGYGSGVSIPGTGIPFNNSLGEPELNPKGYFKAKPGSRLVSNMAPTIAIGENGDCIALGSPGANRITTTTLQGWINYAFERTPHEEIIDQPRLHVENVDGEYVIHFEEGMDVSLISKEDRLFPFPLKDMFFGALNFAGRDEKGNLYAHCDDRRHGGQFVG